MSALLADVDIQSAELRADPYPFYRALREEAPVFRERMNGHYLLTRFEDVLRTFTDPVGFSSVDNVWRPVLRGEVPVAGRGTGMAIVQDDDPYHALERGLFSRAFTPRMMQAMSPFIREVVVEELDHS